jgi:hypothetical protein
MLCCGSPRCPHGPCIAFRFSRAHPCEASRSCRCALRRARRQAPADSERFPDSKRESKSGGPAASAAGYQAEGRDSSDGSGYRSDHREGKSGSILRISTLAPARMILCSMEGRVVAGVLIHVREAAPLCYPSDVTAAMIDEYRRSIGLVRPVRRELQDEDVIGRGCSDRQRWRSER